MCRHLVYLGPPVPLSRLLFEPAHSLAHQSWAPADMRGGGTINADGFGVGWYAEGGPVRYRRATPLWSDTTLPGLASAVSAGAVLAAVRSATIGMPVTEHAAAPFGEGPWLFSHNGKVSGWPGSVAKLAATLPPVDLLTLDAPTDAALLWAFVRDRLRGGAGPREAVADTIAEVAAAAPGSRLNLLLTDGETVVASTYGHSLSVLRRAGSVLVSSEPLDDDPSWQPVDDRTLVVATAAELQQIPLGES
ncbi:ergothioneine biosynthesis protein EgtC [Paractinoplanes brasiliensis]|uniref:Gamma-glutamyl-hercynylcysteine sulfoxide hydrolase n=1 Tax=Paractinoplanes brasiliensis TaxID=52695 RepID=A0A4V3C5X8_9ACTN|nr:ergothioneine biosynthesis protein EgtC [Actinoplanes brasiliensis]TDO31598.1 glutamine amidotransferase [Actinoplanes brasiliensis]GID30997.1 gamma-glutamyl-hercynylcysteine sulfoxide hydrolase [Actinoplanes brasiliensis]